jgi:hypothetical protein
MRRQLSLYVMLASACVFLASLYLWWIESTLKVAGNVTQNMLNEFSGSLRFYGWSGPYGSAAALAALAVVLGAAVALLRPQLGKRLPLATAAAALLYLALLDAANLHGTGIFQGVFQHLSVGLATGAYLGIGSAAVAFLAALAARWEIARRPSATEAVALALTVGLLAAFILPWLHVHVPHGKTGAVIFGYQLSNVGSSVVVFVATLACFGWPLWSRRTPPGRRLVAALGIAVLVGGGLSALGTHRHWPNEAWLQLGCALGLVALALVTSRGLRVSRPQVVEAAAVAAASLLAFSMFLPWQRLCDPVGGACVSNNGWTLGQGPTGGLASTAGGLAVILLVLLLGFRHLYLELAVGAAIYVMASGFAIAQEEGSFSHLAFGAPIGFAGAALLLVAAARRLWQVPPDWKRLAVRFVPMLLCLGFLAIPVATLTGRLSLFSVFSVRLDAYSPWRWDWVEFGAILVGLRLLGRWLGGPKTDDELVLLPLALLAMTVLSVVEASRAGYINWEAWVSIALCVVLAVLGWFERNGGLDKLRIPEGIWRVDRLPEPDG